MKICSRCKTSKTMDDFPSNRAMRDGKHNYCRGCHSEYAKASRRSDPQKHAKWDRAKKLRQYGLDFAGFEELLASQQGKCAICGTPDPYRIDHDHKTGRVRGVLCHHCNVGLGHFKDDEVLLKKAVQYIA